MPYADIARRREHARNYYKRKRLENPEPFRRRVRKSYRKHREKQLVRSKLKYAALKNKVVGYFENLLDIPKLFGY